MLRSELLYARLILLSPSALFDRLSFRRSEKKLTKDDSFITPRRRKSTIGAEKANREAKVDINRPRSVTSISQLLAAQVDVTARLSGLRLETGKKGRMLGSLYRLVDRCKFA